MGRREKAVLNTFPFTFFHSHSALCREHLKFVSMLSLQTYLLLLAVVKCLPHLARKTSGGGGLKEPLFLSFAGFSSILPSNFRLARKTQKTLPHRLVIK